MMLTIDLETYSPQDIGKVGAYRYAQDPDFEILLCSVAIDDYRVVLIDTTDNDNAGLAAVKPLLLTHDSPSGPGMQPSSGGALASTST